MRILVLGTGPFAVPTFESLLDSPHEIVALVTRPVRAAQSRDKHALNPMRDMAIARGVRVLEPENINTPEARAQIAELAPDLLMVCDYGQILRPEILSAAPLGGINLHGSLLPKYRGAAPVQWCVYQGDTETGVTVIHMTPQLDGGPTLVQTTTPIGPDETAAELEPRLARLGVAAVDEAIALLMQHQASHASGPIGEPQNHAIASRAPRLKKSDGAIDWSRSAEQIVHQVRAFQPWPGSYTHWQREDEPSLRLIIEQLAALAPAPAGATNEGAAGIPGEILQASGDQLLVATGSGVARIVRLQPAGKRSMPIAEFLRGQAIKKGDRLA